MGFYVMGRLRVNTSLRCFLWILDFAQKTHMEDWLFGGLVDDWSCIVENLRLVWLAIGTCRRMENRYCEFGGLAWSLVLISLYPSNLCILCIALFVGGNKLW